MTLGGTVLFPSFQVRPVGQRKRAMRILSQSVDALIIMRVCIMNVP